MKVLLDVIYSAKPSHCSSATKVARFVSRTLAERQDVFFRWLVPENLTDEERDWFPKHDNVQLIPYPYSKDRMREYQVFTEHMEKLIAFNGELWDTDVIVTMRTQQVPNMKIVLTSPRQSGQAWLKRVVLFEEMPVMSFKPTVAVSDAWVQDLATIAGYLAADDVLITIKNEKDHIVQTARTYYAPAQVKRLIEKIEVASPVTVDIFDEKKAEHRFVRGQRPFCLGYTGRMTPSMSNLDDVYKIADMNWIMKGDKGFKMVFSTVTVTCRKEPPEFCQVIHLPREQFWNLIRTELDLVICMDVDAGFGMSFMEPLMMGTPMVCPRKEWTESLIGADYPFFVKNMAEAYAVIQAFHNDYEKHYAKFYDWQQNVLMKRFQKGGVYELNYSDRMFKAVTDHGAVWPRYAEKCASKKDNEIVKAVVERVGERKEFVLFEVLKELAEDGTLVSLQRKLEEERDDRGIVWSTAWNDFRAALIAHYGWQDASTRVGHFKRT